MVQARGRYLGSLVLVVGLLVAGCGQENAQLKQQMESLQKENADLTAKVVALRSENEAMKKGIEERKRLREALRAQKSRADQAAKKR